MLEAFLTHHKSKKNCQDTLTIYGEGELFKKMLNFVRKNNLQNYVSLPGFTDNLQKEMSKYDVFLLTSKYEGFGNVIIQAMAAGLPVIAKKNTGGPDDIINISNGVLFNDQIELIKILKDIEPNSFNKNDLHSTASKYSISNICDSYLEI